METNSVPGCEIQTASSRKEVDVYWGHLWSSLFISSWSPRRAEALRWRRTQVPGAVRPESLAWLDQLGQRSAQISARQLLYCDTDGRMMVTDPREYWAHQKMLEMRVCEDFKCT